MKKNTKRVSDLITKQDIASWINGDCITIKAGTGVGKSYFIKNRLYKEAKKNGEKILLLVHRKNCKDQFQKEIENANKSDVIDLMTYQKIESNDIHRVKNIDFSKYAYVICDEFHYFMSDASFSYTTDISLNLILKQTHCVKIFMSATGDMMKQYIKNIKHAKTINYELDIDYDFIEGKIRMFNKPKTIEKYLDDCLSGKDQVIVFMDSAKKAYDLYKKYEHCSLFNCSVYNQQFSKYIDQDKICKLLEKEGFDERILITTTSMDAGVNISYKSVKHIILDVEDEGTLIQCLGRRRVDRNNSKDKLFVYIKNVTNNFLGGRETMARKRVKKAEYFLQHGSKEYVLQYGKDLDKTHIVYDYIDYSEHKKGIEKKKINDLMFFKTKIDLVAIHDMKRIGYPQYISNLLNREYTIEEEQNTMMELQEYLEGIVGKRLYGRKEKNELAEKIDIRDGRNNRLIKGFKIIAPHIKDQFKSTYILSEGKDWNRKNKDGLQNENYGKAYWIILKDNS